MIITILPGPRARKLIEKDGTYVSPSYTRYYPLVVEKAQGLWVHDVDENVFLDFTAGAGLSSDMCPLFYECNLIVKPEHDRIL